MLDASVIIPPQDGGESLDAPLVTFDGMAEDSGPAKQ
jgi:hypothetical protein